MAERRLGAGLRVRIGPSDVGSRVTVRHALPDPGDGPSTSDVVGVLESWTDGVLAVRRRDGTLTEVDEVALVAAKVIPPAPPPRRP